MGEVGQLILPRGPKEMISSSIRTIQQSPIDTKTLRGVITLPDVTIYKYGLKECVILYMHGVSRMRFSYRFRTGNGFEVEISAGATRGYVFLLATSTTVERFKETATTFEAIHESFQLYRKVDA